MTDKHSHEWETLHVIFPSEDKNVPEGDVGKEKEGAALTEYCACGAKKVTALKGKKVEEVLDNAHSADNS